LNIELKFSRQPNTQGGYMKFPQSSSQSPAAAALASIALIFLWPIAPAVNAHESFFKGKTIAIIQGRDPGGTGDLRVKALFPFLGQSARFHAIVKRSSSSKSLWALNRCLSDDRNVQIVQAVQFDSSYGRGKQSV
jgi:hypothetical protein